MRLLRDFVSVVICLNTILPCVVTASLDLCQIQFGEDVVLHTSYKDGNRSCCKSIVCDAGFEAVMCNPNNPNSTTCRPCPPDTYQSHPTNSVDMKHCDAKRTCDVGMKLENDDSSVEDRRCLCNLEKGLCNPSRNRSMFCQRKSCPAGMELNQDCSCSQCLDGYFKDTNGSMPCKLWRNCRDEGKRTVVRGTTTTDAVCSNSTDNRWRWTSTAAKSTTDPDHHSTNWKLVAIVTAVIAAVAISVFVIVFVKCGITQRVYKHFKTSCQQTAPPQEPTIVGYQPVPTNPLPTDAEHQGILREQEVLQRLGEGDPNLDPQVQPDGGSFGGSENDAARGQTLRLALEDPRVDMTREMSDSLQIHRVALLKSLIVDNVLLSLLNINNTITSEMRQDIQSQLTTSSRTDRLLDYLIRRPCLSYNTFIYALVVTKQLHLAEKLNAKLADEYKKYVEGREGSDEDKVLSFGSL